MAKAEKGKITPARFQCKKVSGRGPPTSSCQPTNKKTGIQTQPENRKSSPAIINGEETTMLEIERIKKAKKRGFRFLSKNQEEHVKEAASGSHQQDQQNSSNKTLGKRNIPRGPIS
jgi:hypothetical protein